MVTLHRDRLPLTALTRSKALPPRLERFVLREACASNPSRDPTAGYFGAAHAVARDTSYPQLVSKRAPQRPLLRV